MRVPVLPTSVLLCLFLLPGCSMTTPENPSFPLDRQTARSMLAAMNDDPRPLSRPVVILSGIHDPGVASALLARDIRRATDAGDQVLSVCFLTTLSFPACRAKVIRRITSSLPVDPDDPLPVDLVCVSMGGVVGRSLVTLDTPTEHGFSIQNIYTICTPHLGARLAPLIPLDPRAWSMRIGCSYMERLNEDVEGGPPIIPYARLGDAIVGTDNSAPPGMTPWWVSTPLLQFAHLQASMDPRIIADIILRLRREDPVTTLPPAPLP